jgi:Rieske Fe-S protein
MLLSDLVLGLVNPWEKLYDPSRVSLKSAGTFLKENLNVAKEYVELVTGGDVKSVEEIVPDSGAVIRRGLKKIACYRDPQGAVHERSAICTHLDCVVHWNDLEKTWDCPCHGSRFDVTGQVVNGPAVSSLPMPSKEG